MRFIELHCNGEPRLINIESISEVAQSGMESVIYICNSHTGSIYDECYDNVLKKIKEAQDIK